MKRTTQLTLALALLLMILGTTGVRAQESVSLSFTINGTSATDVGISVVDENGDAIDGAAATLTSSHALKATSNILTNGIVCPNVNGNTSPTIELTFTITGLPTTFSYNNMGLDIHALNSSGNYQNNTDSSVPREFSVAVSKGSDSADLTAWKTLSDIEIAYGVGSAGAVHQVWNTINDESATATDPLVISLTITADATNNMGCFFGLSSIELNTASDGSISADKYYHIIWKASTTSYMTEDDSGLMYVESENSHARQYWQFIPTDVENIYYIRSAVSGRYIGSSNLTPSSSSIMYTTTDTIPYYMGATSATATEIAGCYWFSSTDCDGYSDESNSPRALNKDGASSNVIVWQAGTSRVGSYWRIEECDYDYDPQPFTSSSEIGTPLAEYVVYNSEGGSIDGLYFVGESNSEGYQIVNADTHEAYDGMWKVVEPEGLTGYYQLVNVDTDETFAIDGGDMLRFEKKRSNFARSAQIYDMSCGTAVSDVYLRHLDADCCGYLMEYPLSTAGSSSVQTSLASAPSDAYTLYTDSKITAVRGQDLDLTLRLNAVLGGGIDGWFYFDWDRDGVFEESVEMPRTSRSTLTVSVPEDATLGKSRMRMRITNNGLSGADDDVLGEAIDFIINTVDLTGDSYVLDLQVNDGSRGTVSYAAVDGSSDEYTLTATALGDATFLYWKEGTMLKSVDEAYTITLDHDTYLVAYFSVNSENSVTAVEDVKQQGGGSQNLVVEMTPGSSTLSVQSDATVLQTQVYSLDGRLVARAQGSEVNVGGLNQGTYIVHVVTTSSKAATKVMIR